MNATRRLMWVALSLVAVGVPRAVAAQAAGEPSGPDSVVYAPERGKVTFTHAAHAKAFECKSCHHESRAEKPLTAAREKCGSCHTAEATAPMKTTLKAAFHDTTHRQGTCFDCHTKEAESGKDAPLACGDCHKRGD